MRPSLGSLFGIILNRSRQPLAYILILSVPVLRLYYSSNPYAVMGTFIALGLLLLPVFFEIHKKIMEPTGSRNFDNFQAAVASINNEIDRMTQVGANLNIKYLGLAGYHWPHIESSLTRLLRQSRVPRCTLQLLVVDPEWDGISRCNQSWKHIVLGTTEAMNNFKAVNNLAIEKANWSISVRYYRATPQIWGILINDAVLFFSMAYWDCDRLRGGHNPIEIINSNNGTFEKIRVSEFLGWFEYLWKQLENSDSKISESNL